MKRYITILLLGLFPVLMHAQSHSINDFYEKYKHLEGFTTLHFSGNLLSKMLSSDKNRHSKNQINKISDLTIISTDEGKDLIDPTDIRNIKRELERSNYEELMIIHDHPTIVKILALEVGNEIRELVLFAVEPNEITLISFQGRISLKDMGDAGQNIQVNGKNYWKELASK